MKRLTTYEYFSKSTYKGAFFSIFHITNLKHMLWVLKRIISLKLFFRAPVAYVLVEQPTKNHEKFTIKTWF